MVKGLLGSVEIHVINHDLELLGVSFRLKGQDFKTFCFYRPPSSGVQVMQSLCDVLSTYFGSSSDFILAGDFNLPFIDWKLGTTATHDEVGQCFLKFCNDFGLTQFIYSPTHQDGNILDLVLGSNKFIVHNTTILSPFSTSDHFMIKAELSIGIKSLKKDKKIRLYNKGDYVGFNAFLLNIDWRDLFSTVSTVDEFFGIFQTIVQDGVEIFIPTITKKPFHRKSFPITNETRKLIELKDKLWKKAKRTRSRLTKLEANCASKKLKRFLRKDASVYEKRLADNRNPKSFYRYVKSRICTKDEIGDVIVDDRTVKIDSEKCTLFNQYFVSVFTVDNGLKPVLANRTESKLFSVDFTELVVYNTLKNLPLKRSNGPDQISSLLLKKLAVGVCMPLSIIFQSSLYMSQVPKIWKKANIVPIFKGKGSRTNTKNYRPVSLTCVACRVMESIINKKLMEYLFNNNLFAKEQHGFISQRSTLTQLLTCNEMWLQQLEQKKFLDILYIDLAKAFDSVSHSKLLIKLRAYGIDGYLFSWFEQFLCERYQNVRLGDVESDWLPVVSGVPQGSVLGPTLFLLFINDITDIVSFSSLMIYADDTKMTSVFDKYSASKLQHDIDRLTQWLNTWQLGVNPDKCKVLHIGYGNPCCQYTINGVRVEASHEEKDLGVFVSDDLKFSKHCAKIIGRASKRIALIFRAFQSRDPSVMIKIYKIYIRPLLEYNSSVWSPYLLKDIDAIENVQRSFLRRLHGFSEFSYPDRLKLADLEPLELRRIKADLYFLFKIMHKRVHFDFNKFFLKSLNVRSRSHGFRLRKKKCRKDLALHCFSNRVVDFWNVLPASVVQEQSLSKFKSLIQLQNAKLRKFMKGRTL